MNDELRLTLLGGVNIVVGDISITELLSQKALALLSYLAFTGRSHTRQAVAGLLWGDESETIAQRSLSQTLAELREHVAPYLLITHHRIGFDRKCPYWLDIAVFSECINFNSGKMDAVSLNRGRLVLADASLLDEALTEVQVGALEKAMLLYQGEFLAGFEVSGAPVFQEWVLGQREWLRQLAFRAFYRLSIHYVKHKLYAAGIRVATSLLAIAPWEERARRQLMQLLVLNGQRSAALAQYEIYRRLLADTLGIEPEMETIQLYERIRAGKSPEVWQPDNYSLKRMGDAYSATSGVQIQMKTRHNLAPQVLPFIGRESEMEHLIELLQDGGHRLITLVGEEGVGKTCLALATAATLIDHFMHGVWMVPLIGTVAPLVNDVEEPNMASSIQYYDAISQNGESFPQDVPFGNHIPFLNSALPLIIASVLGLTFSGKSHPQAQLFAFLRDKELLLLLDNFEPMIVNMDFVLKLLKEAPAVTVLVTSRKRLNFQAEYTIRVMGLPVPEIDDMPGAVNYSSVQLFAECARRTSAEFALTAHTLPEVIQVCRLVAGVPLAIELAAAWIERLPCSEVVGVLQQYLRDVSFADPELSPPYRGLRATFEMVWSLLSDSEQHTLAHLSVFRGGFTQTAALEVTMMTAADLALLTRKSLLRRSTAGRYSLHELIRQFAAEKLEAMMIAGTADIKTTQERHSNFYLTFVTEREIALNDRTSHRAVTEILNETQNVWQAWCWAVMYLKTALIHRCLTGLARFFQSVGSFEEAELAFSMAGKRVQALVHGAEHPARGLQTLLSKLLVQEAHFLNEQSKYDQAIAVALSAIGVAYQCRSLRTEASGYLEWGLSLWSQGEYEAARARLEQAQALAQRSQAWHIEADSLRNLGIVSTYQGDYAGARINYEHALRLHRDIGDLRGEIVTLINLGEIAAMQGDSVRAIGYFEQSLYLCGVLNDRKCEEQTLGNLGVAHTAQGDYVEARMCFEQALAVSRDIGDPQGEIQTLTHLGGLYTMLGDYEQAQRYLAHALRLCDEVRVRHEKSVVLSELGLLKGYLGEYAAARDYSLRALRMAEELGDRSRQGFALTHLAHALLGLGEFIEAATTYQQATELRRTLGEQHLAVESIAGEARVALVQGKHSFALLYVEEILSYLDRNTLDGLDAPFQVYLTCIEVLRTHTDARANDLLEIAYHRLLARADKIRDQDLRRSFLNNVNMHRELICLHEDSTDN
ncbi:MAG: tetratricopeptide repeat protein [Anaerolineae bacterium]|nr:tetratricopeptide repeat protein [Anaerolineae bacterium]